MAACKRKSEKMVSPAEDESNASLEHKEDPPGPFECSICLELMLEPVVGNFLNSRVVNSDSGLGPALLASIIILSS